MSPSNCNNTQKKKNMPLAYALNLLSQFEPIPVHIFNEDGLYSEKFNQNYRDEKNVFKTDISFRQKIISIVKKRGNDNKSRKNLFFMVACNVLMV